MWKDLVVEEIRQHRDAYAKRFNYDLHAICEDMRKKQGQEGRQVVAFKPKPAQHVQRAV